MQRLIIVQSNDAIMSYKQFVIFCHEIVSRLKQINYNENRRRKSIVFEDEDARFAIQFRASKITISIFISEVSDFMIKKKSMIENDKEQLKKIEACFYCKTFEHMIRDCLKKKTQTELKSLETRVNESKKDEI